MSKRTIILDYQLGNLFSVKQACDNIGLSTKMSCDSREIEDADGIILPGVGAFAEAMNNIENFDLVAPLKRFVESGKPLFGICLGLQLLFSESEEFGSKGGLNLIPGIIRKFQPLNKANEKVKVPHVGWNTLHKSSREWKDSPFEEVEENSFMYFVHSYYVIPRDTHSIFSTTEYERTNYCSSVFVNNIFATQFHPEKSGEPGLSIYKNWAIQNKLL